MPASGPEPARLAPGLRYSCRVLLCQMLATLMLVSCDAASPDSEVSRDLRPFFEAFAERELSGTELREITSEFIQIHTLNDREPQAIRDIAKRLADCSKAWRPDADSPAALMARHALLEASYFDPDMHGTLELRLMTEANPVRVVDVRARRLMTERDVVALANLRRFSTSSGEPRHEPLSRRQIEQLVAALQAAAGGNSGSMPRFFGEAAAFWTGVQRAWPDFDESEQALARAYAGKTWRVQMPVEMYGRLWGLDASTASARHMDDASARISAITDLNMQLGNLPFVMDSIFGR